MLEFLENLERGRGVPGSTPILFVDYESPVRCLENARRDEQD